MPSYTYITYLAARQAVAGRLNDSGEVFFTDAEIKLYLTESLRTFNALTGFWVTDYAFTVTAATLPWIELHDNSTGTSPRQYTLNDTDLYAIILYHLIESQLSSGTWAGTPQFALTDLTQSFERRQNEIAQFSACSIDQLSPIVITPNTRTITIPDNVLDIRRARYIPVVQPPLPFTLWRGDALAFQSFTPAYRQTPQNPRMYDVSNRPPLTLDVDFAPPAAGSIDLLGTIASATPALPASTPLIIPNDWSWVLKWGMLADILNKQSEAQDQSRAEYAMVRYTEGLRLLQVSPWLLSAYFNNVPVGISSVMERDTYNPGWETQTNPLPRQGIVVAGLDLISVCPRPTSGNLGVTLELVESAPIPVNDGDNVQVPRDVLEAILDYTMHLAMFKCGGQEFQDTIPLFDSFRTVCQSYNRRIANLGLYSDVLTGQGKRQEALDPRYV